METIEITERFLSARREGREAIGFGTLGEWGKERASVLFSLVLVFALPLFQDTMCSSGNLNDVTFASSLIVQV